MTTKTQPTKFEQTHIMMVLDRSQSMFSCRKPTVDSVNKYLAEARGDDILKESDFELLQFDTQSIDSVRSGAPVKLNDISLDEFVPRGGTPLYDAVGRGIDGLEKKLKASGSGKAILVIVTDGEENSSRKYDHATISQQIKAKQEAGWLVVFLGAGLNAARQGISMGVNASYTGNIAMDSVSLSNMSQTVGNMTRSYAGNANAEAAKSWLASGAGALSTNDRKLMGDDSGGAGLVGGGKDALLELEKQKAKAALTQPLARSADTWDKGAETGRDAWSN